METCISEIYELMDDEQLHYHRYLEARSNIATRQATLRRFGMLKEHHHITEGFLDSVRGLRVKNDDLVDGQTYHFLCIEPHSIRGFPDRLYRNLAQLKYCGIPFRVEIPRDVKQVFALYGIKGDWTTEVHRREKQVDVRIP